MTSPADRTSPLLDHCPSTLPPEAYWHPDWAELERRGIWARQWVYVGRRNGFAPGTLRRVEIAGDNLIVVCAADGSLSAFHNTCRHRGSVLCVEHQQAFDGRVIRCPYHAWAYATDGRLVSTAFGTPTPDFIKADHGLFPAALEVWNGFVFLCVAEDPSPFEPDLGRDALDNWPMDALVVGHSFEKVLACNWKVFWENYNECLHCPGVHPMLSDRIPVYQRGRMTRQEAADWRPDEGPRRVLKEGTSTWTMNGQPCGPTFPDLSDEERHLAHNFVTAYPSMFIVAHVDYVRTVQLVPLDPERVLLRAQWLFLPETLAQPDFDLANVTDFATTVLLEDGAACELNQQGLRSSRYDGGRLMPQEFDVHGFQAWVLSQIEDVDAEKGPLGSSGSGNSSGSGGGLTGSVRVGDL